MLKGVILDVQLQVLNVLDEVLSLNGRLAAAAPQTPLLGAVPELDSMAVAAVLGMIEERFGIVVEDDEIDGSVFATVGSLSDFVNGKLAD
jgi:acyl carrier protein